MTQPVLGRFVRLVGVWLGVLTLSFAVRPLAPGDPVDALLFGQPSSPQTVAALRARFGLDQPLYVQYVAYLSGVVRGDLGTSFSTRRPVAEEIGDRFWNTLLLAGTSVSLGLLLGVGAGMAAALKHGSPLDTMVLLLSTAGLAVPSFWFGMVLIQWFAVRLRWLPVAGAGSPAHLVLPALTLALVEAAVLARIARASLLDVLGQDYVRTARAKGLACSGERCCPTSQGRSSRCPRCSFRGRCWLWRGWLSLGWAPSRPRLSGAPCSWPGGSTCRLHPG